MSYTCSSRDAFSFSKRSRQPQYYAPSQQMRRQPKPETPSAASGLVALIACGAMFALEWKRSGQAAGGFVSWLLAGYFTRTIRSQCMFYFKCVLLCAVCFGFSLFIHGGRAGTFVLFLLIVCVALAHVAYYAISKMGDTF